MKKVILYLNILYLLLLLPGCKKEAPIPPTTYGKAQICFDHTVDGEAVIQDSLLYTNAAGNKYMINEIQYFISDIELIASDHTPHTVMTDDNIHYVDTDLPATFLWKLEDNFPTGEYDSIRFTFGLSGEQNQSYRFVNPPQSAMFWPEPLGGGYHYLKLNGKWLQNDSLHPFNFHLGRGQVYANNAVSIENIIRYLDLHFQLTLALKDFSIREGQSAEIKLEMQVNNWFNNPYVYDHSVWGSFIMQNLSALSTVSANGHNVFKVN